MEAEMAYLNRSDQLHILRAAIDDAEIIKLMSKVHFDDDVLHECHITVQPGSSPPVMIPGA